jgi:hypothetical protein
MGDLPSFSVIDTPDGALAAPTYIDARKLAAGAAETVTKPAGATIVVFKPKFEDTIFYVRWDGSVAAEPGGDVSDGSASEPNPYVRAIPGIDTFSIVSPQADAIITMLFYSEGESRELTS